MPTSEPDPDAPAAAPPAKRRPGSSPREADRQLDLDFVRFRAGAEPLDFAVDLAADTIWATARQIAVLFDADPGAIEREVAAVLASDELSGEEHRRAPAGGEGERYDLDVVLSVGYRLGAPKAARFRRWATRMLRQLVVDGYAIDEARLRENPADAGDLAARLRAIRADERNIYESVRVFFATASADYDVGSDACAAFAAMLQNKFVFAATGETPSDLILERADHDAPDMGLKSHQGTTPTIAEAKIARNYLDADELFILHTLCEQFLLTIQGKALRREPMTMRELGAKLDDLLRLDDYPVLAGRKDIHRDRAVRHAQAEYARFIMRAGRDRTALAR